MDHHSPQSIRDGARASPVHAANEWDPLREVVVGVAHGAMFPAEDTAMVRATMPREHWSRFVPGNPFPAEVVHAAEQELDQLATLLTERGVRVHRPLSLDWAALGGYSSAMPRDGLFVTGERIIEAPMAWRSRRREHDAYLPLVQRLVKEGARWLPAGVDRETSGLLDGAGSRDGWVINNTRPAWDAADFLRLGEVVLGQLSHVTNPSGVAHLQERLGPEHRVHLVGPDDPHAMHIDATLCPLREGLALYNPERIAPHQLRRSPLRDWHLVAAPPPTPRSWPPLFMTSAWVHMNLLVVGPDQVVVEAADDAMADLLGGLGFTPLRCPFQHVQSLGGSFHCATLDLRRHDG
ncbi:amidinotransferase [Streptomyces sp. XD-27]|uniref:amidinotransferase n=1 Tax=Streptomyces sp. XD-27 TaxID=3062779 RepID=UPI0026F46FD9|nr:amidinotransferase [Streptomyces sp. XD-27]WKX69321.1 amidinotransferase [Streptomyces sp. XD-27]